MMWGNDRIYACNPTLEADVTYLLTVVKLQQDYIEAILDYLALEAERVPSKTTPAHITLRKKVNSDTKV